MIRAKRTKLLVGLLVLILPLAGGAGGAYYFLLKKPAVPTASIKKPAQSAPSDASKAAAQKSSIRLIATGDWIAHDSVNAAALQKDGSYDYYPLVSDFAPIFKQADIRFCNDPILNGGESLGIHGYPKFNSPSEFVTGMSHLGCNLVNTASNHSFDFSQQNISNSVDTWSKQPNMLAVAGENRSQAEHDAVRVFTVDGVKIAFLAYTTYINTDAPVQNDYGVNVYSDDFASKQIADAKAQGAQFIIASMRWGTEYSNDMNPQQTRDAQFLADQGVDLVLGHGTHELQPVAQLNGKNGNKTTVWYGLGNFLNTQEPAETLFNGVAVMNIDAKTHAITSMSYLPIYMHYEWTAAQAAAEDTNARNHVHLYLMEQATQQMIDAQQLKTTVAAQTDRMQKTLSANGLQIPIIDSKQYLAGQ